MDADRLSWLNTGIEAAIEPRLPIIDPHHHLWDHPTDTYLLDELRSDTESGHNVVKTVFVECGSEYLTGGSEALRPTGETEFVARIAAQSASTAGAEIAGIVGFADLRLGDAVAHVLERHVALGEGRFRGIRHASAHDPSPDIRRGHSDPPPGLMADPEFRRGFSVLGRMGLSFDAWLYHPQLPELVDLARSHPDVSIIVDHLGGPLGIGPYDGRRSEMLAAWRPPMEQLAALPNVTLKLGGIGMPIFGAGWHKRATPPSSDDLARAWGPEIVWLIERFGADRCMFESNFPVDRRSCHYGVLWNAFKRITTEAGATFGDKSWLFHDTAAKVYRLS